MLSVVDPRPGRALISLLLAASGAACTGQIGAAGRTSQGGASSQAGASNQGGASGGAAGSQAAPTVLGALPWPVRSGGRPSALRRLTRDELQTTLEMLTGSAPPRADLPEEPRSGHGPLLTSGVSFVGPEMPKLKLALGTFAGSIAPAMLAKTGCALTQQAQRDCLLGWSLGFAEQALRRPLRKGESTSFQNILGAADGTADADAGALEGVLTAIFFAPSFLYRTEIGAPVAANPSLRALQPSEIASRLSYLATLAPPDPDLLVAASSGRLQDAAERTRQFDRLSRSAFGRRAQAVFVLEWLGGNEPKVDQKSARYLTGLGTGYATAIRASAETFIQGVLAGGAPTIAGLLSTSSYLADPAVQKITQSAGTGPTATGDGGAAQRTGLLMHPLVIAAHTKEDGSSPFQIGGAIREALLCDPVPPPPANAQAMARMDPPAGLSLRESLDYRTSAGPACIACHSQFKELGYSFLAFDPVGRWMSQDPSGKPWELSGNVMTYSGIPLTFASPSELAKALASHPQVQGCFAQVALEWSLGRALAPEDQPLVVVLNDVAKRTGGSVVEILRAIVAAPQFVNALAPR
jgi:hypothetical protein